MINHALCLRIFLCCLLSFAALGDDVFEFQDGRKLRLTFGEGGALYFVNTDGSESLITRSRVSLFPMNRLGDSTEAGGFYYEQRSQKIAAVKTEEGTWIISYTGKAGKLLPQGSDLRQEPCRSKGFFDPTRDSNGVEFLVGLFQGNESKRVETYVVREDGKVRRIDGPPVPNKVFGSMREMALEVRHLGESSGIPIPSELDFVFPSGFRVLSTGGKVYSETQAGVRSVISEEALSWFSVTSDENRNESTYRKKGILVFETGQHSFWAVSEKGLLLRLPFDYAKGMLHRNGGYLILQKSFEYKDKSYALINFPYEESQKISTGETFLIREDGFFLRIDYARHDLDKGSIDGGILTINDARRKIDLDRLEAESKFKLKPRLEVLDADGSVVKDPVGMMEKSFPDIAEEIRRNPESVFEPLDREIIREMRIGLQKEEAGSIVVVGESGGGKTQLVRSFVGEMVKGAFMEIPRTVRVLNVDLAALSQGTKYVGTFEARLKAILEGCKEVPCYLSMDEIHSLRGGGTYDSNSNDVFQMIKTALAEGWIHIIGTTTEEEFYSAFGGDPALLRRFTLVHMKSPGEKETLHLVKGWIQRFKKLVPTDEVLNYLIHVSERFNAVGAQPSKAIALLDFMYSMIQIDFPLGRAAQMEDVQQASQKLYQIDPAHFDSQAMRTKLQTLPAELDLNLIGQKAFKQALIEIANQIYTGVNDTTKPAMRLLVAGPPGVGKTEGAIVYAKIMGLPFKRIEMNRYAEASPNAFLREVAEALRKNPFTVLLFDEFEKANPHVQQAVLAMMDSGIFTIDQNINTSSRGGTRTVRVSARNASIILTTNAAAEYVLKKTGRSQQFGFRPTEALGDVNALELRNAIMEDGIAKVVLDRCQRIIAAHPPSRDEFRQVVTLHLKIAIFEQEKHLGFQILFPNSATFVHDMADQHYRPGMSNRIAHDIVQDYFRNTLANALLKEVPPRGSTLVVTYQNKVLSAAKVKEGDTCAAGIIAAATGADAA